MSDAHASRLQSNETVTAATGNPSPVQDAQSRRPVTPSTYDDA